MFSDRHGQIGKKPAEKECPGLVLLHLNGSPTQTMDFLETARNLEPPVPVIVLTRKPKLDDAVQNVKKGAYDFWTKPFAPERLTKAIELIERAEKQRTSQQSALQDPGRSDNLPGPCPMLYQGPCQENCSEQRDRFHSGRKRDRQRTVCPLHSQSKRAQR